MQSLLPFAALLFNAFVWGLAWWPFQRMHQAGLHPLLARIGPVFTLETMLVLGALLVLGSLVGLGAIGAKWIGSGLAAFVSYGMLNWIPAFLMRTQKMPLEAMATWFAPAAGITFGIGILGGGWLVSRRAKHSARAYGTIPALASAILVPTFIAALLVGGLVTVLAAHAAGLDGIVCSGQEVGMVKKAWKDGYFVVPGLRPSGGGTGDQKRVVTPRQARDNGASVLVIGRPITGAGDPAGAALDQAVVRAKRVVR